jgi:L-asparaginase II
MKESWPELGAPLAEVVRGEMVESIHSGHLLIVDSAGRDLLSLGDPEKIIYPRSAVKSIQAAAMLRAGLKVDSEQLALACASHAGSERHQRVALSILTRVGLDENALLNTPDRPLGAKERRSASEATRLAANCSGKHGAMVATSKINGWDTQTYKDPRHPLQQLIKNELEELASEKVSGVSVDGCGAPLFAISLRGLVRAIATLINSNEAIYQEIVSACTCHPDLVSGEGRIVTEAMEKVPGLFMKEGAEGVAVAAIKGVGALGWKMVDGSNRADRALLSATLSHLGVEMKFDPIPVYGDGRVVGEIRASRLASHVSH